VSLLENASVELEPYGLISTGEHFAAAIVVDAASW